MHLLALSSLVRCVLLCYFVTGSSSLLSVESSKPVINYDAMATNSPDCWAFLIEFSNSRKMSSHVNNLTYPPGLNCVRLLEAPEGQRVVVTLEDGYDIEDTRWDTHNGKCEFDYLLFQDGPYEFSENITKICGTGKRRSVRSSGSFMRITFKTDFLVEKSGFNMSYLFEHIPGYDEAPSDYQDCYFYIPVNKEVEFVVTMKDVRLWKNKNRVDCVWDIHNSQTNDSLWVWIDDVRDQEYLMNLSQRSIEIYPTDNFIWTSKQLKEKKSFQVPTKLLITSSRILIHIYSASLRYVPTFSVNVTTFNSGEKSSERCGSTYYDCEDEGDPLMCIPKSLLCNKNINCRDGKDESPDICYIFDKSSGQNTEQTKFIMIGVGALFLMLIIIALAFTARKIIRRNAKCRQARKRDQHGCLTDTTEYDKNAETSLGAANNTSASHLMASETNNTAAHA